jgi:hypothetical protein
MHETLYFYRKGGSILLWIITIHSMTKKKEKEKKTNWFR